MAILIKLQEEFRKLDAELDTFLAGLPAEDEKRTAEQKAELTSRDAKLEELKASIVTAQGAQSRNDLESRLAARKQWANENAPGPEARTDPGSSGIEIPDAPIYRGKYAMAEQFADVIRATHPSHMTKPEGLAAIERLGRADKRRLELETRAAGAGAVVSNPTAGGFFLESEQSIDLIEKGFGNSEIARRCDNRTMTTDKQVITGIDENSRVDGSRGGGIQVYTTKELETAAPSQTKFSKVSLEPDDLSGFAYFSNRMLEDIPFLYGEVIGLFDKEFQFKIQDKIFYGVGSNEPEGVYNCPAKVTVPLPVAGQDAKTIVTDNILDMEARLFLGSGRDAIWVINQDAKQQLYSLAYPIGTGGVLTGMYQPPGPGEINGRLNGRELVVVEQAETLGTEGDIALIDFSQYLLARRGTMKTDTSVDLKFDYNQTALRIIIRIDGRCRWRSALTPYKGTATVSPIITLAVRA